MEINSTDNNIQVRLAYSGLESTANLNFGADPGPEHEEGRGDIGAFFKINTQNMDTLVWVEVSIYLGIGFTYYDTKWLRKDDMQLAFKKDNSWVPLITSQVLKDNYTLRCNITPEPLYNYDILFENILNQMNSPVFTVVGWLDADGDGYFNEEDAFPFDPAARYDRDSDGSPGEDEWIPGKGPEHSTSNPPLHEDRFPDDPAASIDDDIDNCPDVWNYGMTEEDSTSNLTLDKFVDEPDKCLDTDNDNLPDGDKYNSKPWMDRDDDNDNIPDHYELNMNDEAIELGLLFRFDPKNSADGAADWDGDGRNNSIEYKDETDPFKKDSPGQKAKKEDKATSPILLGIVGAIIFLILILLIYTKLRKDQLLEHKVRAQILDHINQNPGIHYRKILNDLDLQMGVLTHHLNMLERQQYIKSLQDSMYRRFYPLHAPINKGLILSDVQERILEIIRKRPGISQAEIARNLNLAKKVVNYHIKILSDAGFVQMEIMGRVSKCYYLNGLDLGKPPSRFKPRKPPVAG
jgi:DNA-binding MarR family transcriptional regulator